MLLARQTYLAKRWKCAGWCISNLCELYFETPNNVLVRLDIHRIEVINSRLIYQKRLCQDSDRRTFALTTC